jgi:hypothetical protein
MAHADIINENDGEQEEEQVENIIDLNNYGMKPYSWRYEGSGGGGGEGGGCMVINADNGVMDKTWKEIHDAYEKGYVCMNINTNNGDKHYPVILVGNDGVDYRVDAYNWDNGERPFVFVTDSENGYPTLSI